MTPEYWAMLGVGERRPQLTNNPAIELMQISTSCTLQANKQTACPSTTTILCLLLARADDMLVVLTQCIAGESRGNLERLWTGPYIQCHGREDASLPSSDVFGMLQHFQYVLELDG